jgi:hypothetical protein
VLEVKADVAGQTLRDLERRAIDIANGLVTISLKSDLLEQKSDRQDSALGRLEQKLDMQQLLIDRLEGKSDALESKADRALISLDSIETDCDTILTREDRLEVKADTLASAVREVHDHLDSLILRVDRLEGKADRVEGKSDRLELKADVLEGKLDRAEAKLDFGNVRLTHEGSVADQRGTKRRASAAVVAIAPTGDVYLRAAINARRDQLDDPARWSSWVDFGSASSLAPVSVSIDLQYQEGSSTRLDGLLSARDPSGIVYHRIFRGSNHTQLIDPAAWSPWLDFLQQP